jgi:hypothetical protein
MSVQYHTVGIIPIRSEVLLVRGVEVRGDLRAVAVLERGGRGGSDRWEEVRGFGWESSEYPS